MHDAPWNAHTMPGYLLPDDMYALLHDVADELQLLVGLTATSHPLDGQLQTMTFERSGMASHLRNAVGRIEAALQACCYHAEHGNTRHYSQCEVSP